MMLFVLQTVYYRDLPEETKAVPELLMAETQMTPT